MRHSSTARILSGSWVLLLILVLAGGASAQTPVPYTVFQIHGTQNADDGVTASFRRYRNAGDPFGIVCADPCTEDQNAIYGLYAGFKSAYQTLIGVFGTAADVPYQPFDIHIADDHWCGEPMPNIGGDSAAYSWFTYSGLATGSYGCFWFTLPGRYALPFHYPETSTLPYQLLTAHEFTHTEFFGRHFYSYEDFAKAMSFMFSEPNTTTTITDPCDDFLDSLNTGKLLWGLCHINGFQYSQFAAVFGKIVTLYTSGKGTIPSHATSPYQFQHAFQQVLGSDPTDAFLASKQTNDPLQIGDNATLQYGGGRTEVIGGWLSFLTSLNALTSPFPFHLEGAYELPAFVTPPGLWDFDNIFTWAGTGPNPQLHFEDTVYTQIKYDPSLTTFGMDERTLRMYVYNGTAFVPVSDSRVDPDRHIVTGSLTATGLVALSAASMVLVSPTQIIVRAVSGPNVHTRVVLRNTQTTVGTLVGQLVFHAQGVAASASDPTLSYSIASGKTAVFDDVLAAFGQSGSGSVDIVATAAGYPDVSAMDVETGASTFPGTIVPVASAFGALSAGDRTIVVGPGNLAKEQFALAVRTLGDGVTLLVTARDASGATLANVTLQYPANTEQQVSAAALANNTTLVPNESFDITLHDGSAILEAEEAGHGTASHTFRIATRLDLAASATGDALHLARVVAATNADGTSVRTTLQLTNPDTSAITGHLRLLPADGSGAIQLAYSIDPGATRAFTDIVSHFNRTGLGAVDITSTGGVLPIVTSRQIYDGPSTPWQVAFNPASDVMDLLRAGDRTELVWPSNANADFHIGVRTFGKGLGVTIYMYDADGSYRTKVITTFPANTTSEVSAASIVGPNWVAGAHVEIFVDSGNGVIYGSAVNPTTGAANVQIATRHPFYY